MITKEQMQAAGFVPIVYGKYDGRGWTKTLHDKEVVVELYYTPENGFAIDVSIDDDFVETNVCTIPLTEIMFPLIKADISIYDSVELP